MLNRPRSLGLRGDQSRRDFRYEAIIRCLISCDALGSSRSMALSTLLGHTLNEVDRPLRRDRSLLDAARNRDSLHLDGPRYPVDQGAPSELNRDQIPRNNRDRDRAGREACALEASGRRSCEGGRHRGLPAVWSQSAAVMRTKFIDPCAGDFRHRGIAANDERVSESERNSCLNQQSRCPPRTMGL